MLAICPTVALEATAQHSINFKLWNHHLEGEIIQIIFPIGEKVPLGSFWMHPEYCQVWPKTIPIPAHTQKREVFESVSNCSSTPNHSKLFRFPSVTSGLWQDSRSCQEYGQQKELKRIWKQRPANIEVAQWFSNTLSIRFTVNSFIPWNNLSLDWPEALHVKYSSNKFTLILLKYSVTQSNYYNIY